MSKPHQHTHERTLSLADTVVEQGESGGRPTFGNVLSERTLTTADPDEVASCKVSRPVQRPTLDPRLAPAVIPPEHKDRTLVLCFDGTGDQFDADNSNIVQLASLLKKDERSKQMVYYQAGIGTYTSPRTVTPLMSSISKTFDEMFAWNLDAHVMDGYEFLMQNYTAGDRICIFGFSRGAYTARSLAGMLHKVGLLPADNFQQVPFAYKMYTRTDRIGWEQSNAFKQAFSVDVVIEFLGVWDTVSSVGLVSKRLPFTTSNTIVRTFRHALSLDERRAKFKANLWNHPTAEEETLGLCVPVQPLSLDSSYATIKVKGTEHGHSRSSSQKDREKARILNSLDLERINSELHSRPTDVEEVWFSGCHCDVGGGSVRNKTRHSLARISLRWMVRECFKANTGIMFDVQRLKGIGLDPSTLYPFVTPRPPPLAPGTASVEKLVMPSRIERLLTRSKSNSTASYMTSSPVDSGNNDMLRIGTEEEEDLKDALSPAYDQLKLRRRWWILEIIPMKLRYQKGNKEWVSRLRPNLACPRYIPRQRDGVKVHRTVKLRMEASYPSETTPGKKYRPKAQLSVEPSWVD